MSAGPENDAHPRSRQAISPWHAASSRPARPRLTTDHDADVVVVGAGMLGLTTALMLKRSGARVVVLEAREVAAAASGNNTAKLTALQGLAYSRIASIHPEAAPVYARANQEGIELVASLVAELGIECGFRRTANFTWADQPDDVRSVEREHEAASAAGLDTVLAEETPLPFETAAAVRLADQAEFDPVAFLRGLADELDRDEPVVFERSRVRSASGTEVTLESGASIECERVVLATHMPIVDRVGLFSRAEPVASFAVTARLPGPLPEGMYIDSKGEYSLRGARVGSDDLLIVGGQGHRLGEGDSLASIAALERFARARFGATAFEHHWDAHDFVTEDRLPFVGAATPLSDLILTATGMNKWGLALGAACGRMLAEAAGGRDGARPAEFDSRRLPRLKALTPLAEHGLKTAVHLAGDRLKRASAEQLEPGEGAVVGSGLAQHATYRDDDGELHSVSARCTHLGCIVAFNRAAKTWDCPCHGSRFATDGSVLEGPATAPLAPRE